MRAYTISYLEKLKQDEEGKFDAEFKPTEVQPLPTPRRRLHTRARACSLSLRAGGLSAGEQCTSVEYASEEGMSCAPRARARARARARVERARPCIVHFVGTPLAPHSRQAGGGLDGALE